MGATTLSEARVYVGTYAKYNNGSLSGAWLDLSDYSDKEEFYEACRELHGDDEDAEYMFQDWENVPEGLIGESWISENFFSLRDAVEDLSDTEQEAFFVWCNYKSHDLGEEDADDLVRDFRDEYQGQYNDKEDFAYEVIEECYDLPEFAKTYFDYEKLPVTCSCAITGLMTALYSVRHNNQSGRGVKALPAKINQVYNHKKIRHHAVT
jgi:hypothetical protein